MSAGGVAKEMMRRGGSEKRLYHLVELSEVQSLELLCQATFRSIL